ncbi:Mature parasite-infected erythrocyte surface antigen (MESA) or PfEMP2, partial [Reticulomyxa filosa]
CNDNDKQDKGKVNKKDEEEDDDTHDNEANNDTAKPTADGTSAKEKKSAKGKEEAKEQTKKTAAKKVTKEDEEENDGDNNNNNNNNKNEEEEKDDDGDEHDNKEIVTSASKKRESKELVENNSNPPPLANAMKKIAVEKNTTKTHEMRKRLSTSLIQPVLKTDDNNASNNDDNEKKEARNRIDKGKYLEKLQAKRDEELRFLKELQNRQHPFNGLESISQYKENYELKFIDTGIDGKITPLPVFWKCMFYHQRGEEWQFEEFENEDENKEEMIAEAWKNNTLRAFIPTYEETENTAEEANEDEEEEEEKDEDDDEDGNENEKKHKGRSGEGEELLELPEFVYNFTAVNELMEYVDSKYWGGVDESDNINESDTHETLFVYRIRRWMPSNEKEAEEAIPYESLPGDKPRLETEGEATLVDDLVCIQNKSCLDKFQNYFSSPFSKQPTWHRWLKGGNKGLRYIRKSGLIDTKYPICGKENNGTILEGVCQIGDFVIGASSESAQSKYSILRLDALAPAR